MQGEACAGHREPALAGGSHASFLSFIVLIPKLGVTITRSPENPESHGLREPAAKGQGRKIRGPLCAVGLVHCLSASEQRKPAD